MQVKSAVVEYLEGLLDGETYLALFMAEKLREKWPQLNTQSRIVPVKYHTVRIDRTPRRKVYMDDLETVREPISGWYRLKLQLYPHRVTVSRLDDPDERWRYTVRLWKALVNAPKYILWRIAGRIFRRRDWIERGYEYLPSRVMPMPVYDEIRLEHFGLRFGYGDRLSTNEIGHFEDIVIVCGYYAPTDTLYVRVP